MRVRPGRGADRRVRAAYPSARARPAQDMQRRDLAAGQKAMIGLAIAPHLEAAAKERQIAGLKKGDKHTAPPKGGARKRNRDQEVSHQIGKASGVGHATVSKARRFMHGA